MKKPQGILRLLPYRGIAQLVEQRSPKPRVQGPSPCAPAKEKWLETVVLSHFSFFSTSAHGSGKSELTREIGRQFRIWSYPFVLFPFGTSSKKHQSAAVCPPDFPFSLFSAAQILTVRAGRSDGRFRQISKASVIPFSREVSFLT